jgi:hypothetical protein
VQYIVSQNLASPQKDYLIGELEKVKQCFLTWYVISATNQFMPLFPSGIYAHNYDYWLNSFRGTAHLVEYKNWCPSEPSSGPVGSVYLMGSRYDTSNYCWDDAPTQSTNYGYICEKDRGELLAWSGLVVWTLASHARERWFDRAGRLPTLFNLLFLLLLSQMTSGCHLAHIWAAWADTWCDKRCSICQLYAQF